MAEKKMTRKEALTALVEIAAEWKSQNFADDDLSAAHTEEAIAVAQKMIASLEKASSKPKGKTTARIQNEKYFTTLLEKMKNRKNQEPVTPKWIAENITGVRSTQRAVWVAKIGLELGEIKEIRVKKDVFYALADWEPAEE